MKLYLEHEDGRFTTRLLCKDRGLVIQIEDASGEVVETAFYDKKAGPLALTLELVRWIHNESVTHEE